MIQSGENVSDNQIISLWQECFGDDRDYIVSFLKYHPDKSQILTVQENGELASMLFLLDCEVVNGCERFKSWYIYAACTGEKFRRRGMMAKLLNYAAEKAAKSGISFILLVPAEEYLFDYYAKFGYKTCFYKQENSRTFNPSGNNFKHEITSAELLNLREKFLKNSFHVKWDEKALQYALSEYAVSFNENSLALWYKDGENTVIAEKLGNDNKPEGGKPFGMALPCGERAEKLLKNSPCGYLGLALD